MTSAQGRRVRRSTRSTRSGWSGGCRAAPRAAIAARAATRCGPSGWSCPATGPPEPAAGGRTRVRGMERRACVGRVAALVRRRPGRGDRLDPAAVLPGRRGAASRVEVEATRPGSSVEQRPHEHAEAGLGLEGGRLLREQSVAGTIRCDEVEVRGRHQHRDAALRAGRCERVLHRCGGSRSAVACRGSAGQQLARAAPRPRRGRSGTAELDRGPLRPSVTTRVSARGRPSPPARAGPRSRRALGRGPQVIEPDCRAARGGSPRGRAECRPGPPASPAPGPHGPPGRALLHAAGRRRSRWCPSAISGRAVGAAPRRAGRAAPGRGCAQSRCCCSARSGNSWSGAGAMTPVHERTDGCRARGAPAGSAPG